MARRGKGQKVQAASGQEYGQRVAQEESQEVVPLHREPTVRPGGMGSLVRPTERPNEALTAGAPIGPGPGPGALPQKRPAAEQEMSVRLAAYLPILETKAAQPDASANFRMFVRRVRHLASDAVGVF